MLFCRRRVARKSAIRASSLFTNSMNIMFMLLNSSSPTVRHIDLRAHQPKLLQPADQRAQLFGKRAIQRRICPPEGAVRLLGGNRHGLAPHFLAEVVQRVLDVDADQRVDGVAGIGGGLPTKSRPAFSTSLTSIETIATRMSPLFR